MIKNDYLLKAVANQKQIRIILASSSGVVEEARKRHITSATASAALGRVMTAALLMASDLKAAEDLITIKIDGKGPAGSIIATANGQGEVRGYISNPQSDLPSCRPGKLAVGSLVGTDGYLEVSRDMGLKQPFVGRTHLISGEIAEDLAHYFLMSEQIPSLVSLGVLVGTDLSIKASGGIIIQALPGAEDRLLERLEENLAAIGQLSHALQDSDSLEALLGRITEGVDYEEIATQPLIYRCNCSYQRLARVLTSLGEAEISELGDEAGEIEVCCNFCNEKYVFRTGEILGQKSEKP